jgi:leader peptidase (prepilin peptidase)/N-methyltransferase
MDVLISIFVFIFGAIIGSFFNVVILRHNTGKKITGRSGCFSCGKKLNWFELIPIFSFLLLRGRCSECQSKISWQYPVVEFLSGILFVFFWNWFDVETGGWLSLSYFLISVILWSSLLIIFFYDLKHKIIPDLFSLLFSLCALTLFIIKASVYGWGISFSYLLGSVLISGFFFFLWFFSNGRWMGFGDVKLVFGIGLYLGLSQGLSALAFAFWIGAGFALLRIFISKFTVSMGIKRLSSKDRELTMKSEVPFAPFLIIGTFIALVLESDIFQLTLFFNV